VFVNLRLFMSMYYNFVFHKRIFTVNEFFCDKVFYKDKKNPSLVQQYLLKIFNLMKLTATTFACLLLQSGLFAQLLPVKNSFQSDLARVISDYPSHFKNLAGESVVDNPQAGEYACIQSVHDAVSCKVVKYSSATWDIYSWQAVMLRTDKFEEAAKKFHLLFSSINNLSVNIGNDHVVIKGKYTQPTEEIKFTSALFDAGENKPEFKKLKVELLLEAEMLDWTVKVLVYEKEREDHERGRAEDK
jgi:hypothetical protein